MTHPRAAYRTALRAAFALSPGLAGVTVLKAWSMPADVAQLPAMTVVTPAERVVASTGSQVNRSAEIVVILRAHGAADDIEDLLDGYAASIEAAALPALKALIPEPPFYGVTGINMKIDGDGSKWTGTVEVQLEVVRFAAEGAQS